MALPRILNNPHFVRYGVRIDTAPEWTWLALFAAALWPAWWWLGRRMLDGSDDPLGLMALAMLGALAWRERRQLRAAPRLACLGLALAAALSSCVVSAMTGTPSDGALPLAGGLLAVLAVTSALLAWLPTHVPAWPVAGLALLALPLRLFVPDAGIQDAGPLFHVAWLACFTTCGVTLHTQRSTRPLAPWLDRLVANLFLHRVFFKTACLLLLPACALSAGAWMVLS